MKALVQLGLLLIGASLVSSKTKPVTVTLEAQWKSTPFVLEASEFLAKESSDLFWKYGESLFSSTYNATGDEEQSYNAAVSAAESLLQPAKLRLLKFSLALREHSPAINVHNQLARQVEVPEKCRAFVNIHGKITCDPTSVLDMAKNALTRSAPALYDFDHVFPAPVGSGGRQEALAIPTVLLYSELGTPEAASWHAHLSQLAAAGDITYVFRHYVKHESELPLLLSGYGVELAIKSTEYKAKDDTKVEEEQKTEEEEADEELEGFDFKKLRELHPDLNSELGKFRTHLSATGQELTPLKVWQLQDLSFQASQYVMSQPDPEASLVALRDVSQNLPVMTSTLVRTKVKDDLKAEIQRNQQVLERYRLGSGDNLLSINGLQIDLESMDVFALMQMVKQELATLSALSNIGVQRSSVSDLMRLDLSSKGGATNYAVDIRSNYITWINDLEKDSRYRGWPRSVQELLRPAYPGMLRHVAKNFFHAVFIVNPAQESSRELLKMAEALIVHQAPAKLGVVCISPESEDSELSVAEALCRAFYGICKAGSPEKALSFITEVYENSEADITVERVRKELARNYLKLELEALGNEQADKLQGARDYLRASGLGATPQVLLNGAPLSESNLAPDMFEEALVGDILKGTGDMQRAVYRGDIHDGTDLLDWIMQRDNVMPRLNPRVLAEERTFIDLQHRAEPGDSFDKFEKLSVGEMTGSVMASLQYMLRKDVPQLYAVTFWVAADIGSPAGRALLYNAVKHMKQSHQVRVGLINNPKQLLGADATDYLISSAVHTALRTLPSRQARSFVPKLLKEDNVRRLRNGEIELKDFASEGMDWTEFEKTMTESSTQVIKSHALFCKRVLKLSPGQRAIVANGRVIGPLDADEEFEVEDFGLLEKHTLSSFAAKVKKAVAHVTDLPEVGTDLILRVSPALAQKTKGQRFDSRLAASKHSVLKFSADPDQAAFDLFAVVDPASSQAQKLVPILMVLRQVLNCNVQIALNPREMLSEMPVKSFYQSVLEAEPDFGQEGPQARFPSLPQRVLLTLHMHAPESWMVSAVRTPHDLDNIMLHEVQSGIRAEFALEHLLLEGHCFDASGQPPRGLQFAMGAPEQPPSVDTIVMANLGYFQLKANPGVWQLQLREGRSADIYTVTQHENTNSAKNSTDVVVVMDSFKSRIIQVKVDKRAGKERESVLQDDSVEPEASGGLWDTISSSFTGSPSPSDATRTEDKDETLNIFSLASGHLYERLLRIMMLSVIKQTKSKVKFWFLRNYLSPSFKDFIPHMAREYGFEYELVHYKWPRWLNQQTEKQRIIWGYKILFLDVLFPLSVKKIIFVDADQIVRTDLQELYDLDLGGAPYGYTPFCDSRKEMDGFRFWSSGYWASHLAGRKYHISALYVIDLKKFRRIAAGDRLRGQYQALSQDPNSLSNLDQDLPNNMIHQVPIKSLPQEWLWCETWCSDESKAAAKTIDLCNNPLTKEPKLVAARRILPEWTGYDQEVKALWDRVYLKVSSTADSTASSKDHKKHVEL